MLKQKLNDGPSEFDRTELDWSQFHQHFTPTFFANILAQKNAKSNILREKLLNLLSYKKPARKMLMKLTPVLIFIYSYYQKMDS